VDRCAVYRQLAVRCMDLARGAAFEEERMSLLKLAQLWLSLAEYVAKPQAFDPPQDES